MEDIIFYDVLEILKEGVKRTSYRVLCRKLCKIGKYLYIGATDNLFID